MFLRFLLIFGLFSTIAYGQSSNYSILNLADSLKHNANAVVRLDHCAIKISSQRSMTISQKRIITVLNEYGLGAIEAAEHYDKKTSVQSISASVLDASGNEIKKLKRKDFKDNASLDGVTMFSDSRYIALEYTPTQYPFTIIYESTVETSNTAFIPQWFPQHSFFVSIEKSILDVTFPDDLGFKKKEFNFATFDIAKTVDSPTQLSYELNNLYAHKVEDLSPSFADFFPHVMMGLEKFNLEGVDGTATTWQEFGKWYSEKLLTGTTILPEETKQKVRTLVGSETDPVKKARLIYEFVQQKSRYVSIQVGIGGFKPMLATDVDRLGYGDCKALSNYTRALLEAVDVPSYNTLLFGTPAKRDIESDFVAVQGNHMILAIPNNDGYIWLECTSQVDPFGYQGTFTDDRDVLVIEPEGGKIVRTKSYGDKTNTQLTTGNYTLAETGIINGSVAIVSVGTQYSRKFGIESLPPFDRDAHYKEYWSNISNLKINKLSFSNDKQNVSITENAQLSAADYGKVSGNRLIFPVNAFNQMSLNYKKVRNRKMPFEINRGYFDNDEIEISLPEGYSIEAMPTEFTASGKFGEYTTKITEKSPGKLIYSRTLFVKKGVYSNDDYEQFRQFMEKVARNDNAKIVLIKQI